MGNHVHLAVQVAEVPLSRIIQNLAFRHTRWVNRRQRRVGHLFPGRFKAILVDADAYLLELLRYIHLNPVRAGLVEDPVDFGWSGHRAYLGLEDLSWLHTDWVLGQFAKRLSTCRKRYKTFVSAGMAEEHRDEFRRGGDDSRVLAEDRFVEQVLGRPLTVRRPPKLHRVIDRVCEHYEVTPSELSAPSRARRLSEARGVIGWLARETGPATLSEVASRFHRDPTTVSRIVVGSTERRTNRPRLRSTYAAFETQ
jgi:hypothetical protein